MTEQKWEISLYVSLFDGGFAAWILPKALADVHKLSVFGLAANSLRHIDGQTNSKQTS
jgi:hypothetical protein